jgi:hypothetical protein
MNFEQSAEFIINIRPVHFSVRACYKTVKRYVHKGNYFSHKVLFFIVVQKANSFHDAVMRFLTHHHHDIRSDAWRHCECNAGIGAFHFIADTNQG